MQVRPDAGGCVDGWENNGCNSEWMQVGVWMSGGNNGCKSEWLQVGVWMSGATMDASPTGCKSDRHWWSAVYSIGCVNGWENSGCKSDWMQVRPPHVRIHFSLPPTQGLSLPLIPGRIAAGELCVGRLLKLLHWHEADP